MGILQIILAVVLLIETILIATKKIPISIPLTLAATIGLAVMLLGAGLEKIL